MTLKNVEGDKVELQKKQRGEAAPGAGLGGAKLAQVHARVSAQFDSNSREF